MLATPFRGIGLRRQHFTHLLEAGCGSVEWFEIISEDLFGKGGRPWAVATAVRRERPVVLHGTGLSIGNAAPLSDDYLDRLEQVMDRLEPAWVSDHLSWGSAGGVNTHELLPIPYTQATLDHVAARLNRVQDRLRRRILLENPSTYLAFRESTLTEWEFLAELVRRTGAGVLLDVNNVFVSSQNLGFSADAYVDGIPAGSVGQIHVAGHTHCDSFIMDTHVGPVPDAVWSLYRRAIEHFGSVPTLVEWDTDVPAFEIVAREADHAEEIARSVTSHA
jgi:uncharacterized protein (UPF0276 family)